MRSKMSSSKSVSSSSSEDDNNELRRGPWTLEEDNLLTQCIADQGEGRWNFMAKCSGLKRTGKSCRLRWLNYLKPDVKRGNLTPQEQLLILELHSKWGNRWSKIAQHLPGRTDNEIKNYWRTRIQKQAKHLKIDSDSPQFQELVRRVWIPRLLQKSKETCSATPIQNQNQNQNQEIPLPPLDVVSHSHQYSAVGKIPADSNPCVQHISDSEQNNGSCISISETVYVNDPTRVAPHFLGSTNTTNPFNDLGIFAYDDCYHENSSNVYEMENFNMATTITTTRDVEYPLDHCQVAEISTVNNDFACAIWKLDELWPFGSLQK